jgi:hypothetical protein
MNGVLTANTLASDEEREEPAIQLENPFVEVPPLARQLILAFITLYGLLITVVPMFRASGGGGGMVAVGLANLTYLCALCLPMFFWRREYGWAHPLIFTSLYALLTTVMRETGLFLGGMPEHTMLPQLDADSCNYLLAYGTLVKAIGAAAVFAGFHMGPKWRGIAVRSNEPNWSVLAPVAAGAVLVSLVSFYLYVSCFGNFNTHLLNLARGSGSKLGIDGDLEAFGHYIFFIKMGAVAGLILIVRHRRALANPLILLVCTYGVLIGYLVDGKRSALINCALLFGVAWILRNRRVPYLRVAALGVACFFLLGLLGLYRWSNWSRTDEASFDFLSGLNTQTLAEVTLDEMSNRAGEASTYYPILARVPGDVNPLWGQTYTQWVTMFVPRALWPDKPRGVDVQAARIFNGVEWGNPASAEGEAYWNFLLPGVVVSFFAYGSLLRWLGAMVRRNQGSTVAITFYAIVIFQFDMSQNGVRATIYALAPAALLFVLAGYFRRPAPAR